MDPANKMMSPYKRHSFHIATTILLLTLAFGSCYTFEKVTYDGFTLFRTYPQREQHLAGLRSLKVQEDDGIEFWTEPCGLNRTVDVMVSPGQREYFTEQIRHLRLPTKRIMYDVGEVIKRTNNVQTKFGRILFEGEGDDRQNVSQLAQSYYSRYQRYSAIERRLKHLAESPRVTLDVIGQSYEGRNMYLLKVSSDKNAQKPVILLDAGHHAREWISHATIMYIMESLITERMPLTKRNSPESDLADITMRSDTDNCDEDEENLNEILASAAAADGDNQAQKSSQSSESINLASLLDKYDFWFYPTVNPDGYEYSHTYDRLWRKTRSRTGWCTGVDPNRNYPFHWLGLGTSSNSCAETYAGPRPLSEPETKLLAGILKDNASRISMYVTLHSYSQVILTPYGYDRVVPDDYSDLIKVAQVGVGAIYSRRGTLYRAGGAANVLYPAAGGSDDFAYQCGIKYTYTIELPDKGNYGFLLPPSEIVPVGQETVAGLFSMISAI